MNLFIYTHSHGNAIKVDAKTGVEHIRQYLRSFGRYGKGALLYPVYGVSEYVQGFCR